MLCAEHVLTKQTNSQEKLVEGGYGREDLTGEATIEMGSSRVRTWKRREKASDSWQDPESEQKGKTRLHRGYW